MNIKFFLKKEWFLLLALLPFVITFLFLQIWVPLWNDTTKNILFYSIFSYDIALILLWIYHNHSSLFEKDEWIRNTITIVGCGVILLWTYKHKITFRLDILLLFLCTLYGIIHRKIIKPTVISILFFIFIIIRIIALSWAKYFDYGVRILFEEESIVFFLLIPIILLGFSVSQRQQISFTAICFKGFLLLLIANMVFYSFASKAAKIDFFSFITLNKGYFFYYEALFWSKFKHPSFISWIILLIGGLGGLVYRKDKKLITNYELTIYALLILCFTFIVQARVTIISYFIVTAFFIYLSIEKYLTQTVKYSLFSLLGITAIGGVWYLVTHTVYFTDPIRNELYARAFTAIGQGNLWIGNGSGYQRYIMEDLHIGYVHNDFIATLVDTGILGLSIFILWLGSIVFSKNIIKQYLLLAFLPIMNTDVLFYVFECTYILIPLIIFILFTPKYSKLQ